MAAYTVIEIGDAFFAVLAGDVALVMLVTAIAGVIGQAGWVAYLAGIAAIAMVDGETMGTIIGGWRPCSGGVATVTG